MKAVAQACTTGTECASGFCTDSVCCDSLCGGQCEACDVPGVPGKCTAITGTAHGKVRSACNDGGGDVCRALSCDGAKDRTKCVAFASGEEKECSPATCRDGTATPSFCDGSGACKTGTTTTCGNFACGGSM